MEFSRYEFCHLHLCFSCCDLGLIHSSVFYCAVILSVLMLDEAHERTLYTDIAIGLLKKVILADSVSGTKSTFVFHTLPAVTSFPVFNPPTLPLRSHSFVSSDPSLDSEKAARPAADCGLCHTGCQGDCIIKMSRLLLH